MRETVAIPEVYGRVVQVLREMLGLTSRDLAERLGVGSGTVGRIEAGRLTPTLPQMDRICAVLNARSLELSPLAADRWTFGLLADLIEHVLRSVGVHFDPVWDPEKERPDQPQLSGVQVAGLVRGPVIEWVTGAREDGWPSGRVVPRPPGFGDNQSG